MATETTFAPRKKIVPSIIRGSLIEQVKQFFRKFDRNGDGVLDKEELKEAFKCLGAVLPGWRASRGLKRADANGDGSIGEEELTELAKYAIRCGYVR